MGFGTSDFRRVFDENRDHLFRFLFRLTRHQADADDLLQETFLTVWRKRDQFEGRGSEAGYLRQTAFRLYLNEMEKRRRRAARAVAHTNGHGHRGEPETPPADRQVDRAEAVAFLVRRVEEAVAELPDGPREAFVLFRFEGLTAAEIGEATGENVKTVETRLRRATQLLSERLGRFRPHLPAS